VWELIHRQTPYKPNKAYQIDKANYYREHILNIPCSSNLTEEQVREVACLIKKYSSI
jgi:perosamine synthetase